jgi:hypothetical protein
LKFTGKNFGEDFENKLTKDHNKLKEVKNECREIVEYIHYKVDPSIEYYMEKSEILIDEDVKYFMWSESSSLILKLRKEMIDYFEEKKASDIYDKWINDEEVKMLKSFKFTRTLNLYMKHSEYMDKRHKYMYEDDYLPILEVRRAPFYLREIKRMKCRFIKQRRMMKWKKNVDWVKKRNLKRMKERFDFQRSIYRHQFCQDNKLIFSKKVWKYLKKNEGISIDWRSFNKV